MDGGGGTRWGGILTKRSRTEATGNADWRYQLLHSWLMTSVSRSLHLGHLPGRLRYHDNVICIHHVHIVLASGEESCWNKDNRASESRITIREGAQQGRRLARRFATAILRLPCTICLTTESSSAYSSTIPSFRTNKKQSTTIFCHILRCLNG